MKLVIERKRWLRGHSDGVLLNTEGKMCCLGFACDALGAEPDAMLGAGTPEDLDELFQGLTRLPETYKEEDLAFKRGTRYFDTNVVDDAVEANDSMHITDAEREPKIKEILARAGFEVEFV